MVEEAKVDIPKQEKKPEHLFIPENARPAILKKFQFYKEAEIRYQEFLTGIATAMNVPDKWMFNLKDMSFGPQLEKEKEK